MLVGNGAAAATSACPAIPAAVRALAWPGMQAMLARGEMGKFFPMRIARLPYAHLLD